MRHDIIYERFEIRVPFVLPDLSVISQFMEQGSRHHGPGPASQATIEALYTHPVTQTELDDQGECPVCLESVFIDEDVTVLPCAHWFHGPCVKLWLSMRDACPKCRCSISSEHEIRIS